MTAIAAISVGSAGQVPGSTSGVAGQDVQKSEESGAGTQVDLSKVNAGSKAKGAEDSSDSAEPAHIRQLREMIKKLQKQLADEQKQLALVMAQKMEETAKLAAISARQASIATLNGEILQATAQLLEALQKTGGSSAGGMVSTQA